MGPVVPILIVVIFWMVVGVFAVTLFRHWLRIPTEAEVEMAHAHEPHEPVPMEGKVEPAAAR